VSNETKNEIVSKFNVRIKFLNTAHISGFCQLGKDLSKILTVHMELLSSVALHHAAQRDSRWIYFEIHTSSISKFSLMIQRLPIAAAVAALQMISIRQYDVLYQLREQVIWFQKNYRGVEELPSAPTTGERTWQDPMEV
jgi:hypothetical protein